MEGESRGILLLSVSHQNIFISYITAKKYQLFQLPSYFLYISGKMSMSISTLSISTLSISTISIVIQFTTKLPSIGGNIKTEGKYSNVSVHRTYWRDTMSSGVSDQFPVDHKQKWCKCLIYSRM